MLRRILSLIHKEFLAVWRDKKSRVILILPPAVQLFVFAFAATLDVENVSIGIVNLDNGKEGFELEQRFYGSKTFTHITQLESSDQIAPFINLQKGVTVVSIKEDFSKNLIEEKGLDIQFISDGRKSNTAQIVTGYITKIVEDFARDFASEREINRSKIVLIPRNEFNHNLIYYWFTVPGLLALLTMLEALVITALSVAREKELGTYDQLLVSPLNTFEVLIGKTIPAVCIAVAAGTLILLSAIFIFRIPFTGSFFLLYLSMLLYIFAIIGVGLFLSSLCNTQQQAILGAFVFMTPAIILSGFATPVENMVDWLQYFTYFNPVKYFILISRGLFLKNMTADIVFMNLWPLVLIAACTLSGAGYFFHKRLQ